MGMIAHVRVNTTQRMALYRHFIIQEAYDAKSGANVWEWTHEDFGHSGKLHSAVTGSCQTIFEAIEAVESWHDEQESEDDADYHRPDASGYSRADEEWFFDMDGKP